MAHCIAGSSRACQGLGPSPSALASSSDSSLPPPRPAQAARAPAAPHAQPAQPTFPAAGSSQLPHAADRIIVKFKSAAGVKAASRPKVVRLKAGADARAAVAAYRKRPGERGGLGRGVGLLCSRLRQRHWPSALPLLTRPRPLPRPADVAYAVLDHVLRPDALPNDAKWSSQWGLKRVGAPAAWDTTTGSEAVTVCVIDSGVDYTHPDIAPNMHPELGWNQLAQNSQPMDDLNHGTHVAGIIGAAGNNANTIAGVNWQVGGRRGGWLLAGAWIQPQAMHCSAAH